MSGKFPFFSRHLEDVCACARQTHAQTPQQSPTLAREMGGEGKKKLLEETSPRQLHSHSGKGNAGEKRARKKRIKNLGKLFLSFFPSARSFWPFFSFSPLGLLTALLELTAGD